MGKVVLSLLAVNANGNNGGGVPTAVIVIAVVALILVCVLVVLMSYKNNQKPAKSKKNKTASPSTKKEEKEEEVIVVTASTEEQDSQDSLTHEEPVEVVVSSATEDASDIINEIISETETEAVKVEIETEKEEENMNTMSKKAKRNTAVNTNVASAAQVKDEEKEETAVDLDFSFSAEDDNLDFDFGNDFASPFEQPKKGFSIPQGAVLSANGESYNYYRMSLEAPNKVIWGRKSGCKGMIFETALADLEAIQIAGNTDYLARRLKSEWYFLVAEEGKFSLFDRSTFEPLMSAQAYRGRDKVFTLAPGSEVKDSAGQLLGAFVSMHKGKILLDKGEDDFLPIALKDVDCLTVGNLYIEAVSEKGVLLVIDGKKNLIKVYDEKGVLVAG